MNKSYVYVLVLLIQLLLIVSTNLQPCTDKTFLIVDAGSSGTRFHIFNFVKDSSNVILKKTSKFKSKVALSRFSSSRADWSSLRMMFSKMIEKVVKNIKVECKKLTEFYVKATAGLRQLNPRVSNRILKHVRGIVKKSGFKHQTDSVSTINTAEEGRLAWVTVNFLKSQFKGSKTYGCMDLGGGSTQIAFETSHPDLAHYTKIINIFGKNYSVYSGGYDYQGINVIRLRFLKEASCSPKCPDVLRSGCINDKVVKKFTYGNLTVNIGGSSINGNERICHCYKKALGYIKQIRDVQQYQSADMPFYGISALYYIISAAKAFQEINSDKVSHLKMIIFKLFELCNNPPILGKGRFDYLLCMDLSYVVALLHNGYKFELDKKIILAKKINSTELSWALGFAITKI